MLFKLPKLSLKPILISGRVLLRDRITESVLEAFADFLPRVLMVTVGSFSDSEEKLDIIL